MSEEGMSHIRVGGPSLLSHRGQQEGQPHNRSYDSRGRVRARLLDFAADGRTRIAAWHYQGLDVHLAYRGARRGDCWSDSGRHALEVYALALI